MKSLTTASLMFGILCGIGALLFAILILGWLRWRRRSRHTSFLNKSTNLSFEDQEALSKESVKRLGIEQFKSATLHRLLKANNVMPRNITLTEDNVAHVQPISLKTIPNKHLRHSTSSYCCESMHETTDMVTKISEYSKCKSLSLSSSTCASSPTMSHLPNKSALDFELTYDSDSCRKPTVIRCNSCETSGEVNFSFPCKKCPAKLHFGRLHSRLWFDFATLNFVIELIDAENLYQPDSSKQFADLFVTVEMKPSIDNVKRQSSVKRKSCANPVFNEFFHFPMTFDQLTGRILYLVLHDYDKFSRPNGIGEVAINLNIVHAEAPTDIWSDVQALGRLKSSIFGGEIFLTLNYLPVAECLTLVVIKARNLKMEKDSYARIDFKIDGTHVKRMRTSPKRRNSNPVWNETFLFNLTASQLSKLTLQIDVVTRDISDGEDEVIGSVEIGNQVTGSGREHWLEVTSNLRKTMAMWHSLFK